MATVAPEIGDAHAEEQATLEDTALRIAREAARLAEAAADDATTRAARAANGRQEAAEEAMHTAHAHSLDAARYAKYAAEDHAAGALRSLPNYARSAIAACRRAQVSADVPDTTADLTAALDAYKTPEELRDEADRKARSEREYEEQQRAETGMDATNRAKRYRDVGIAKEVISKLGWSRQMLQAVRYAADGRVWLDSTGTVRLINRAGAPGRVIAADRIRLLRQAGYLNCDNDVDVDTHLRPTAEARRVLYLADLHPGGIHRDDRTAHTARLRAALTGRRSKQDARNAAARLPRMDRWAMRHADDLPITLVQQQEAAGEPRRAEVENTARQESSDPVGDLVGQIADHLGEGWAVEIEVNPYHQNVRYLYLVHTDGRRLRAKEESHGGHEGNASRQSGKLHLSAILPDTDRPIRSDERSNASVTIARGPEAIARHLNGERFIGRYSRTLTAITEFNAHRECDKATLESLGHQLARPFSPSAQVTASPYSCEIEARHNGCSYSAKIYQGEVSLDIGHMPMPVAFAATAAYESAMTAAYGVPEHGLHPVVSRISEAASDAEAAGEEPPTSAPRGPVEELAEQIADHLGDGWTSRTDSNRYVDGTWHSYLVHPDGRTVGIQGVHRGWDSRGRYLPAERVRAWGVFPITERRFGVDERPETTAAIARGARAIAKQLAGDRFMGRYSRALQAVVDYNADKAARTAAMAEEGHRLAALLAHGATVQPTAYNCEVRSLRERRKFKAQVSSFGVRLDLGYMPPPVALAVTAAFEAAMTDHRVQPDLTVP